jgi:hypothetical protein
MPELTQERLRELLDYDPETGVFVWKVYRARGARAGDTAGTSKSNKLYLRIGIDRINYYAHRLAWFWVTGVFPKYEIDHKDGDGFNNRFSNLREATHGENGQNLRLSRRNKSGYRGVYFCNSKGSWASRIVVNYVTIDLGQHSTPEKAYAAYLKAKASLHPFQPIPRSEVGDLV